MGKKYLHQNFNLKVKHFKTSKKRKENKISIKFINANYLIKNIKKKTFKISFKRNNGMKTVIKIIIWINSS